MGYDGTLTDEHLALIAAQRDRWMTEGLSTRRADRPAAEAAVARAYVSAGLTPPESFIWADSPAGGVVARAVLRNQLGNQLVDQLGGQLWDQLDTQGDAYWVALFSCATRIANLFDSSRIGALADAVSEVGGWWWPHERVAILTERPTAIHRDPQGRLHADDGPALTWADGYAQHWWHGTAVPEDFWIWDLSRVLAERNAEVRRCGIERHGWDAVTDRLTLVGEADDPGNPGQRLELYDLGADLADLYPEPARILLCTNGTVERDGTRRRFGLPVPATHTDPVAAAADLYGWPVEAYRRLEVRT